MIFLRWNKHTASYSTARLCLPGSSSLIIPNQGNKNCRAIPLVSFTEYELNKQFAARYFGNEVSATTQLAYEQDSSFWNQARTVPLTPQELRFIRYKDSLYRATHTRQYLDSIDRLTNRITWQKLSLYGTKFLQPQKRKKLVCAAHLIIVPAVGIWRHPHQSVFLLFKNLSFQKKSGGLPQPELWVSQP